MALESNLINGWGSSEVLLAVRALRRVSGRSGVASLQGSVTLLAQSLTAALALDGIRGAAA
jgi:hypothetical protein